MTPEWYFMLLNDPQGLWNLLRYYLTVPFTSEVVHGGVWALWNRFLHPFALFAISLFLFMMIGALIVSGIAIRCDLHREKKKQMEIILARHQQSKKTD